VRVPPRLPPAGPLGAAAFVGRLYRRHAAELSRSLAVDDGEDLVQEAFLKVLQKWSEGAESEIRIWPAFLRTIALNVWRDRHRRQGRERLARRGDRTTDSGEPADVLAIGVIRERLRRLPEDLHAVYRQRYVLDCSEREAAGRLQISYQRFRSRQARLLAALRADLGDRRPFRKR
jgi:RNA polymerase sigma factor (sigma-70 family)